MNLESFADENEIQEQMINEIRSVCSSKYTGSVEKEAEKMIEEIKNRKTEFKITQISDPFVSLFVDISNNNKESLEMDSLLHIVRVLIEFGSLEGDACRKIFDIIDSLLIPTNDNFNLKAIQVAYESFSSNSLNFEARISAAKWLFKLSETGSVLVKQVSNSALYQMIDLIMEQITKSNENENDFFDDNEIDELTAILYMDQSSDSDDVLRNDDVESDNKRWSAALIFSILDDLISILLGKETKVFDPKIDDSLCCSIVKYIMDGYMNVISLYTEEYKKIIEKLISLINSQKEDSYFVSFAPHVILSCYRTDVKQVKALAEKLCSMLKASNRIFNTISAIFVQDPDVIFNVFNEETLIQLSKKACKYFLINFRGSIAYSFSIYGSHKISLDNNNNGDDFILVSCASILFSQIANCDEHLNHFSAIFDSFETIWQRIFAVTEDSLTLSCSLRVARKAVRIGLMNNDMDSANRILSTLCGIALPQSESSPLDFKAVASLHSVVKLINQVGDEMSVFWPFVFETVSKCYGAAILKRTDAELQVFRFVLPSLLDFSSKINEKKLSTLFNVILKLSKEEVSSFIEDYKSLPNYWPIMSIYSIVTANISRTADIEADFFNHLEFMIHCGSKEFRMYATRILFDVSKYGIDNESTSESFKQRIFDCIFSATNSSFKDVSTSSFSSFLQLLSGGTAENIGNGWLIILTVLKSVWTGPFEENIETGFRVICYICRDCLIHLQIGWIEILLSTINSYISQRDDMNTSLGAINLFWDIASGITPISTSEHISVWKSLFRTLQRNFRDKRQNVRIATLGTFFNIVSTFKSQFPDELESYTLDCIFHPLYTNILNEISNKKEEDLDIDVYLLALQNGIQCIQSFANYQEVMLNIIRIIEQLSQITTSPKYANESLKCYTQISAIDNKVILNEVTFSIHRIISSYFAFHKNDFMQGAATIITEMLASVSERLDDEEFIIWVNVLNMFCNFQIDKPFLNVATHVTLNFIAGAKMFSKERMLIVIKTVLRLMDIGHPPLTVKCFDALFGVYSNVFDEENRSACFSLFLPTIMNNLEGEKNIACFKKILELPANLSGAVKEKRNVVILTKISEKYPELKDQINEIMSKYGDSTQTK